MMNRKTCLFTCLILFAYCIMLMAQQNVKLTLEECVDIALKNNSQLRVAQHQVELAATSVTSARASWLPSVNTSFSSGKFIQGAREVKTDVPVGIDPVTQRMIYEERKIYQDQTERMSHSASISLDQNIYDFGRTMNGIRQAKANKKVYEHQLINTKNMVMVNVAEAYYELLKAYKLYDVYKEAVKLAEENLDYSESMLEVGLAARAEIYQALVNVGTNRTNLINQENMIQFAKANLNNAMGQNPDTPVDIVEDESQPLFPDYDFDQAVSIASEQNEELKALEQQVKAYEYSIRAARAQYAPSIGGHVSYSRDNDDISRVYSSKLDEDFSVTIGAGINLNIFNGLADKAEVQRQKLNHQIALESLYEQKRLLIAQVKEYFLALQAYKDIIEINKENLDAYKENLRLQQEKRRVGSGTELEVTQAQVEVTQAQEELVRAEYNAKIRRAYLEAALGIIGQ